MSIIVYVSKDFGTMPEDQKFKARSRRAVRLPPLPTALSESEIERKEEAREYYHSRAKLSRPTTFWGKCQKQLAYYVYSVRYYLAEAAIAWARWVLPSSTEIGKYISPLPIYSNSIKSAKRVAAQRQMAESIWNELVNERGVKPEQILCIEEVDDVL